MNTPSLNLHEPSQNHVLIIRDLFFCLLLILIFNTVWTLEHVPHLSLSPIDYICNGSLIFQYAKYKHVTIIFSILLQFLNQDEYLKGVDVYVSIIKAYASYVEHTRKEGSKDEL